MEIIKNLALEILHRQRILKEIVAMDLLEKQFSDLKMSGYPDSNIDQKLLKIKTKDDQVKEIQ